MKIYIFIILFLFYYSPPLHILGIPGTAAKIIPVIGFIHFALLNQKKIVSPFIRKEYIGYLLSLTIAFGIIYFITELIYRTNDTRYLKIFPVYYWEYFLGTIYVGYLFEKKDLKLFFQYLIAIGIVQSCIMMAGPLILPLKQLLFNIYNADPASAQFSQFGWSTLTYRGLALSADRNQGLAIFQFFILMLVFILGLHDQKKYRIVYALIIVILIMSGLLSARTYFAGFLFLPLLLIKFIRNGVARNIPKITLRILLIIFGCITVIGSSSIYRENADLIGQWSGWAFEMFLNYEEQGELSTRSSNELLDKHLNQWPDDVQTYLIGDPDRRMIDGFHYKSRQTDSGYIILLYYFGIIGSLVFYLMWIVIYLKSLKLYISSEYVPTILTIIIAIVLLSQIKLEIMPISGIVYKIILFFYIFGVERKYNDLNQINNSFETSNTLFKA